MKKLKISKKRFWGMTVALITAIILMVSGTFAYVLNNQHRSDYLNTMNKIFDLTLLNNFVSYDLDAWTQGDQVDNPINVKSLNHTAEETYTNAFLAVKLMEYVHTYERGDWLSVKDVLGTGTDTTQALFAIDENGDFMSYATAVARFGNTNIVKYTVDATEYAMINSSQKVADKNASLGVHGKPLLSAPEKYTYGDKDPFDAIQANGATPVINDECDATPIGGWYPIVGTETPRDYVSFELSANVITLEDWMDKYTADPTDASLLGDFWVLGDDGWAYYAHALAPNDETTRLLESLKLEKAITNLTYYMHIDMVATDLEEIDELNPLTSMPQELIDLLKDLKDGTPPPDEPLFAGDNFTVAMAQPDGSSYVPSTNSFDDSVTGFYFITDNASKAGTSNVNYTGVNYPITTTYVLPEETITVNGTETITGSDMGTAKITFNANSTYFFDEGTYIDTGRTSYNRFSKENISLVGLYSGGSDPETVITRLPRLTSEVDASIRDTMERYIFNAKDIYIENLIFDGLGKNMYPTNPTSAGKNRGEYFWTVTGDTGGFFAKDVVLRNIGASRSAGSKNIAINLMYTDVGGVRSTGNRNFEDIRIENTKTSTGWGIVTTNQIRDSYFKNLDMSNNPGLTTGTYPIKVEHNATANIDSGNVKNIKNIVFDGNIVFPATDMNNAYQSIYVQDYNYSNICVPSEYKYASCRTNSNGSSMSSAVCVYKTMQPVATNTAYLDLNAEYWIMREANSGNINSQLTALNSLASRSRTWTSLPLPRIKVIALDEGSDVYTVKGFTVPDYAGTGGYNNTGVETHIVVLAPKADGIYAAKSHATDGLGAEFVQFTTGTLAMPATNTANVKFYNLDFRTQADYTLADALGGQITNFVKENAVHTLFKK